MKITSPIDFLTKLRTRHSDAEIARRLSAMIGRAVHRNQIQQWFHQDRSRRVEPRFSVGLAMLQMAAEEFGEIRIVKNGPETTMKGMKK